MTPHSGYSREDYAAHAAGDDHVAGARGATYAQVHAATSMLYGRGRQGLHPAPVHQPGARDGKAGADPRSHYSEKYKR